MVVGGATWDGGISGGLADRGGNFGSSSARLVCEEIGWTLSFACEVFVCVGRWEVPEGLAKGSEMVGGRASQTP